MLRLHGIIGSSADEETHEKLHHLEHRGSLEYIFIAASDAGRKRFRAKTDRGTVCAVSLDREEDLFDGAVLHVSSERAVVVRFGEQKVMRLRGKDAEAQLKLGWNAGNLHWRVRFEGDALVVLLDGPQETYRARIKSLIDTGDVIEINEL